MKKFKFSLEILLNVKEAQKKQLIAELTTKLHNLEQKKKALENTVNIITSLSIKISSLSSEGTKIFTIKNYSNYYEAIQQRYKIQKAEIKRLESNVSTLQNSIMNLQKETDALEKLEKNEYKTFCMEISKLELKNIEELLNYQVGQNGGIYG